MATYQPGIPTGSVPLNQDYLNIQGNFTQLDNEWKVDHVPLTTAPGPSIGYHTFVHLVPFSTTTTNPPKNQPVVAPAATPGFGQLFGAEINDGINTDQALYYLSGGNRLTQLTRNVQPSNAANGFTFLPGGLLLQWGTAIKSTGQTVTFPQAFTTAVYSVVLTVNTSPANIPTAKGYPTAVISGLSSFLVGNNDGTVQGYSFNWMAIGN